MYFEASMRDKDYQLDVQETPDSWRIALREVGGQWIYHSIPKNDFRWMDDAVSFIFEDSSYMVDVVGVGNEYTVYTRGSYRVIPIHNDESLLHESLKKGGNLGGLDSLTAGMPGKIVQIFVEAGDSVKAGQPLLVMEAMKMENEMRASHDGKVARIAVKPGDSVESGALLISFE